MWTIGRQAGLRRDTDFMAGKTAVSARNKEAAGARFATGRGAPTTLSVDMRTHMTT